MKKRMEKNSFDCRIYQKHPQMVLGFHGCDQSVVDKVLSSHTEHLRQSRNDYDWLGSGVYFWLNDPQRAYEWAVSQSKRKKIKNPAVIGAIIDLGNCFNLCERESVLLLQRSYQELSDLLRASNLDINREYQNKTPDSGGYMLLRPLDCLVINHVHEMIKGAEFSFDTVYGYFQEGSDAYPGAGILEKSHIQICVRNPVCIKGYFLPRKR